MALYVNGKKVAGIGLPGKSAYQYAVDGGYTGTEEEFNTLLANVSPAPKAVSVVLRGWHPSLDTETNKTYYECIVTVPGVLADETKQLITPAPALASQAAYLDAGVLCTGQAANSLTFTCQTVPEADLTVYIVITDVKSTEPPAPTAHIYGAEWDGSAATTWTRTDEAAGFGNPSPAVNNGNGSSPFDNLMPWSGMVIEEDAVAGTLVKIPKYWYKWTRSGNTMKLQIADGPEDGFHVSPAHADRGDGHGERDVVYVGRYHCSMSYKSQAGSQPLGNITKVTARTSIHNLGGTIWQYDFAMYWTIMMLYLVEYANWNSQATIGYGCSPNKQMFNMGLTDAMVYHTGTSAASRDTYGCCQYRHIEGLWDNAVTICDGVYFSGANVYCIKNPDNFSDAENGVLVGQRATSIGFISAWTNPTAEGYEYALYPNAVSGSESTFVCDKCFYNANGAVLLIGGSYGQGHDYGAFHLNGQNSAAGKSNNIGCRLQKLP